MAFWWTPDIGTLIMLVGTQDVFLTHSQSVTVTLFHVTGYSHCLVISDDGVDGIIEAQC